MSTKNNHRLQSSPDTQAPERSPKILKAYENTYSSRDTKKICIASTVPLVLVFVKCKAKTVGAITDMAITELIMALSSLPVRPVNFTSSREPKSGSNPSLKTLANCWIKIVATISNAKRTR